MGLVEDYKLIRLAMRVFLDKRYSDNSPAVLLSMRIQNEFMRKWPETAGRWEYPNDVIDSSHLPYLSDETITDILQP